MRAVNLLPADLRGAVKAPAPVAPAPYDGGGSGAFIALGVLALCVFALAGYVLTTNAIKQSKADLAALEVRNAAVLAETARLKPYADFASLAQARIATVHDLAAQRFDWEGSLRDLARALPQDVSVKTLDGSISSAAGGASALRGALDVPAIELTGCTSDQPSVARMMARVRAVDGVTRVSLSNAAKNGDATAAMTADSAAATAPAGCEGKGKSDPADFSVVVFFENNLAAAADPAAPASATSVAGAGAAGATPTPTPAPGADQPAPTTDTSSTTVPTSTEAK